MAIEAVTEAVITHATSLAAAPNLSADRPGPAPQGLPEAVPQGRAMSWLHGARTIGLPGGCPRAVVTGITATLHEMPLDNG